MRKFLDQTWYLWTRIFNEFDNLYLTITAIDIQSIFLSVRRVVVDVDIAIITSCCNNALLNVAGWILIWDHFEIHIVDLSIMLMQACSFFPDSAFSIIIIEKSQFSIPTCDNKLVLNDWFYLRVLCSTYTPIPQTWDDFKLLILCLY